MIQWSAHQVAPDHVVMGTEGQVCKVNNLKLAVNKNKFYMDVTENSEFSPESSMKK